MGEKSLKAEKGLILKALETHVYLKAPRDYNNDCNRNCKL